MGFLTDLKNDVKAALPGVVIVGRDRELMDPVQIARVTQLNQFAITGAASLQPGPPENTQLMRSSLRENHYAFIVTDWVGTRFAEAPPLLYDVKEEKSFRKYQSLNYHQKLESYSLRSKALEEVEEPDDKLFQLLKKPNPYQDWAEFAYEMLIYWIFGNGLVYGPPLELGRNKGQIRELYNLPTAFFSGKNPGIAGYGSYVDNSGSLEIPGSSVLHMRRMNPDAINQQQKLWGMAKFTPARRLLEKSNSTLDAEREMMMNRGARTLIFPKQAEDGFINPNNGVRDATEALRKKLNRAGTNGVAGFDVEIGALAIGMSPVDLNIIESTKVSKEDFCGILRVNVISVFSSMEGSTYANKEESDKSSVRQGVLPDLRLWGNKLNQFLLPGYNQDRKYKRFIEHNTDVYPELQEDKKKRLEYMIDMGSSINERREANGWSKSDDPNADIILYPSNQSPITDLSISKTDQGDEITNDDEQEED